MSNHLSLDEERKGGGGGMYNLTKGKFSGSFRGSTVHHLVHDWESRENPVIDSHCKTRSTPRGLTSSSPARPNVVSEKDSLRR